MGCRSDDVGAVALGGMEKEELNGLDVSVFSRAPPEAMLETLAWLRCSAMHSMHDISTRCCFTGKHLSCPALGNTSCQQHGGILLAKQSCACREEYGSISGYLSEHGFGLDKQKRLATALATPASHAQQTVPQTAVL
jgi:hypothetical protein